MAAGERSYAGDASPKEAWKAMQENPKARLVDVRTQAEWAYVGLVTTDPAMSKPVGQQWQVFPDMQHDTDFTKTLSEKFEADGTAKDDPIYFLCRSGARSLAAAKAMTASGYTKCYNIAGGFEGDVDGDGHRGNINGWKASKLPWRQQ